MEMKGVRFLTAIVVLLNLAGANVDGLLTEEAMAQSSVKRKLTRSENLQWDRAKKLSQQVVELIDRSDFGRAGELAREALDIQEKLFGNSGGETGIALNNLAMVYQGQGRFYEATQIFQRVVGIFEKEYGPEHENTATALLNLAVSLENQALHLKAEPYYLRVLSIREKSLGSDHPATAMAMNELAILYQTLGRYTESAQLFQKALRILETRLGDSHLVTVRTVNNLALLYKLQGNHRLADQLYRRALNDLESTVGPGHLQYGTTLSNLASLCAEQAKYSEAKTLYERAVNVYESSLGPDHPDTATVLSNVGLFHLGEADYDTAESHLQRAWAIQKSKLPANHPSLGRTLNNLGLLRFHQGNPEAAESFYRQAAELFEQAYGSAHPDTIVSLQNLAQLYFQRGDADRAMEMFDDAKRRQRTHLFKVLPALSAHQQASYLRERHDPILHVALNAAVAADSLKEHWAISANWLANSKGTAHLALAQQSLVTRDLNHPERGLPARELLEVRNRLASLSMTRSDPADQERRNKELNTLTAREAELLLQLGNNPLIDQPEWIEHLQVQKALPTDTKLIDIARFYQYDFDARGHESAWNPARYGAWITNSDNNSSVVYVDLGDADQIDALIADVRSGIQSAGTDLERRQLVEEEATADLSKTLAGLAARIVTPLLPHISDAEQIVICPDGDLWLVPWNALPVGDEPGESLIERFVIQFVVSGRDLCTKVPAEKPLAPVIIANPSFDQQRSEKEQAILAVFRSMPQRNTFAADGSQQSLLPRAQPLPNTELEATAIGPLLERYTGSKATLYHQGLHWNGLPRLSTARVVEFATHGFFLPKREDRFSAPRQENTEAREEVAVENPLLRCGLLLAGCNHRDAVVADDDGI
ncbi:MAG: tetratricopeptide repeat protein [Planctomycetaceae bacterium]